MIQKTTILFMALTLLAIFARGQNNGTAGGQNNTASVAQAPAAPAPATPKTTEVEGTGEPAGNGTSSSAYLNYGLGASFVLLAAL